MTTQGAPAGLPISGSGCQCGGACELRLSYPACRAGYLQSGRSAHRDREQKPERQHLGRRVEPSISLGELGASIGCGPAAASTRAETGAGVCQMGPAVARWFVSCAR